MQSRDGPFIDATRTTGKNYIIFCKWGTRLEQAPDTRQEEKDCGTMTLLETGSFLGGHQHMARSTSKNVRCFTSRRFYALRHQD